MVYEKQIKYVHNTTTTTNYVNGFVYETKSPHSS